MIEIKPLLKSKFVYVWISQILSQLTLNIVNFLLLTRLYTATGSTIATSLLWVAYALPAIFIGPFASVIVDMADRRKILMISNLMQAITIGVYSFMHESQLFLLYGVVIVYSIFNQFYVPAESASVPSLIKKKFIAQASGMFLLTQQASIVVGFGLAGPINSLFGFEKTLTICASLLFLAFVSTVFLPSLGVGKRIPKSFEDTFFSFFTQIAEGYKFIKEHRVILMPFFLSIAFQVALTMVMVNVPLIAKDILGVDVNSSGLSVIVPAGLGAAVGTLSVPALLRKRLRKKTMIEISFMLIISSIFILTFVTPELVGVLRTSLSILAILLIGYAFIGVIIPSLTLLQENTPGGMRGRVFGNFTFLVTIATIFPVVFSGAITEIFGIRLLLFLFGAMSMIGLILSKNMADNLIKVGT